MIRPSEIINSDINRAHNASVKPPADFPVGQSFVTLAFLWSEVTGNHLDNLIPGWRIKESWEPGRLDGKEKGKVISVGGGPRWIDPRPRPHSAKVPELRLVTCLSVYLSTRIFYIEKRMCAQYARRRSPVTRGHLAGTPRPSWVMSSPAILPFGHPRTPREKKSSLASS